MNILVIGSGAIGGFYGALLARQGCKVSLLARSDYETVKRAGIHIHSDTRLGDWDFVPATVIREGESLPTPPDYVLLCVKIVPGLDRAALLGSVVGPNTVIVQVCNGIDVDGDLQTAFPNHRIISGLAFICVTRTSPGQIWHQTLGRLVLGNYPHGADENVLKLVSVFSEAGINCAAADDIVTARWQKTVWNAPFNPLSVLSGGLSPSVILRREEQLVRGVMSEITEIAAAAGHPLPDNIVELNIASTLKMPPYKTSMLIDFEAGRPLETEVILGNAVRKAQSLSVPAPRIETLYAALCLREAAMGAVDRNTGDD